MASEYEPLFTDRRPEVDDLAAVRELFQAASGPYLRSPVSWLSWAVILPGAALATPAALQRLGPSGVLLTWSLAILAGGAVEITAIRRGGPPAGRSLLAAWALRTQGNLSLVALVLSALLVWQDLAWALPGLWLLLLGHSFYILGGLSFAPFRPYGLLYQAGGLAALWPRGAPLIAFALTAATANLWMAYAVWRERLQGPVA
jgi:hypothetical protein